MCWLTVGLLLGEPGSKLVHVLISLLSNQVENESGVSGWLGEQGKCFPCFPSWGISVSKKIHVFCYGIVVTLVWWYIVVLDVYYVLARLGCPQPSKIVASVLTYTFRECLVCFVMLDWSSEDMIQFSLYYLWCPVLNEN